MSSSKGKRRRLLIIHHASEFRVDHKRHLIHLLIPIWKEAGVEVTEIFGIREAPPADVAFLHIDTSVVPSAYLKFARKYPVVINGKVGDIRKSRLSLLRVDPASNYTGPVIVKSALNYAGDPEKIYQKVFRKHRTRFQKLFVRQSPLPSYPIRLESKADYRIYATPEEVPPSVWKCDDLVVEKFMPEQHDGLYCLREWYFFGDQSVHRVELSPNPIFTSGQLVQHLDVPAPTELEALRSRLGFDYGKFDYTMIEGKPCPFDFNKTTGVAIPLREAIWPVARKLASGLDFYFKSQD